MCIIYNNVLLNVVVCSYCSSCNFGINDNRMAKFYVIGSTKFSLQNFCSECNFYFPDIESTFCPFLIILLE